MNGYNRVVIMGNLTRDVELRHTPSQTAVANIGLAVNRKYKKSDGSTEEEVTFVDCDVFGKTAEVMAQYAAKGSALLIEGRLKLDTWKDKTDGSNRSKLKVVCENFTFVGGKPGEREAAPAPKGPGKNYQPASHGAGYEPIQESEIPF